MLILACRFGFMGSGDAASSAFTFGSASAGAQATTTSPAGFPQTRDNNNGGSSFTFAASSATKQGTGEDSIAAWSAVRSPVVTI